MNFKQFWLLIALGLAFGLGNACAELALGAVVVSEEVIEHNLVVVSTDVEAPRYSWWVVGPRGIEKLKFSVPDKSEVVFTGPPGEYRILLTVIPEQGEPAQSDAIMSIVKGDLPPNPDPDPDPDPDPTPDPIPSDSKWQVVIIYESNDLDNYPAGQVAIIKSLNFRKRLMEAGHVLLTGGIMDAQMVNRNNKPPKLLAPYYNSCKGDPLPRLCISPLGGGGVVQDFDLPADEDGVLALLKGAEQ